MRRVAESPAVPFGAVTARKCGCTGGRVLTLGEPRRRHQESPVAFLILRTLVHIGLGLLSFCCVSHTQDAGRLTLIYLFSGLIGWFRLRSSGRQGCGVLRPRPGAPACFLPALALLRPAFPRWHLPPQRPCTWTCLMSVTEAYDAVVRIVRQSALLLPVRYRVLWGVLPSRQS